MVGFGRFLCSVVGLFWLNHSPWRRSRGCRCLLLSSGLGFCCAFACGGGLLGGFLGVGC